MSRHNDIEYYGQQTQEQPQKPKHRRRKNGYRVFTVITFVVLTVYLLGYLINFALRPSVRVESVEMGAISAPSAINGLIIREETVVTSGRAGTPVYYYTENQRVAKGKVVCSVQDSAKVDMIETEIDKIDRDIIDIQKNRTDISAFSDDIKNIEKDIETVYDNYSYRFISGDISGVYDMKDRIKTQMNNRTGIWVAENSQSLSTLQSQRLNYENQLGENKSNVQSTESGIISYRIDGFEDVFTPETMADINKENFKMTYDSKYISKAEVIAAGDPLFKIVSSNIWYIAAYVPENECAGWAKGDSKELFTTVDEEEKSISVSVYSITHGDSESFVVFKTDKDILAFISERYISFKINEDMYEGFKIPNEAIVEKSFLKVPAECIIESEGETGVLKRNDGSDTFVNVNVANYDEQYAYVLQTVDGVKIGDIVLKGDGDSAEPFTVSDLVVYKGVYVANSSMARFKIIDVIGQNADYTIVDSSSGYGLRIYDKIVSDASQIEESQTLY